MKLLFYIIKKLLPTGKQCGDPEYSCPKDIILLIKIVILSSAVDASFNSMNICCLNEII